MKTWITLSFAALMLASLTGAHADEPADQVMEEIVVTAKYPDHLLMEEIVVTAPYPAHLIMEEILVSVSRPELDLAVERPQRFF